MITIIALLLGVVLFALRNVQTRFAVSLTILCFATWAVFLLGILAALLGIAP